MAKNHKLSKHKEALPNRVSLAYEAMFAETEQKRRSAQVLLDLLPREARTNDEQIQHNSDIWLKAPTTAQLALSPAGRQILEMVADSKPVAEGVQPMDSLSTSEPLATKEPDASPTEPRDPTEPNDIMAKQLSNWPPRSQQEPPKVVEQDEPKRMWVAAKPSPPDTGPRPIADSDFDNNKPLY